MENEYLNVGRPEMPGEVTTKMEELEMAEAALPRIDLVVRKVR